MTSRSRGLRLLPGALVLAASLLGGAAGRLLGVCGPFTDAAGDAFCSFVLEIFYLGITTGTTPTTFDPGSNVSRLQMAAFLSRTVDGALRRGSRRASLDQFWTTQNSTVLGLTTVGTSPHFVKSDGADLWVGNSGGGTVSRVRASDGKLLETWTGATNASGVLVAMGRVFLAAGLSAGLYRINPTAAPGAVETVATNLGNSQGIAFDGARIWTANLNNSVSIVTPGATIPWTVTTVTTGFGIPIGALYDGANIWISDASAQAIRKLDAAGAILQTATVGSAPQHPVFDGSNIWVPNNGGTSVSVVRASSGAVLATLTGNGLNQPLVAAFDGQRVLVTNNGTTSVSVWKAADLTEIGTFGLGPGKIPYAACSDGIHFWIALSSNHLARF
jgi:hypothetical protein